MGKRARTLLSTVLCIAMLLQTVYLKQPPVSVYAADSTTIFTDYLPEITEVTNTESGFTHPGVGLTKELLENVRTQVRAGAEPWNTYFNQMLESSAASTGVNSSNQSSSDSSVPNTYAFNSQGVNSGFIADALKAYTQALLYYITGNEIYRSNAMHIIRIWSQMDPAQYEYFTDACIHTGIPLNRMVAAAEILRYSSCQTASLAWTKEDTDNFTKNLITPVIETFQHDQNHFMNQHNYPLLGAMAGYIFTDNVSRYKEAVEWFTVNKTADDQGFNGSVKQLFRWIDKEAAIGQNISEGTSVTGHVQHVEMGRDQAHAGGDLTNSVIISRMLLAQETKVDPTEGTVSTASNAVGPYEFLNNRILAGADYFWQYMLGYDTQWTKAAYSIASDGTVRDTYNYIAPSYRGRFNTANFWDLYSYYTYVKGEDVKTIAPYYYQAFTKKLPSNFYYQGSYNINWNNSDGGGDFWLYLPEEAKNDADRYLPEKQTSAYLIDIEDRYTAFDNNSSKQTDTDGTSYVRFTAVKDGSKIALLNASTNNKTVAFRIRTNGTAELKLSPGIDDTMVLPDTKGAWRYVSYTMDSLQSLGDILYLTVTGNGTLVDIDHLNVNAGTLLTPPVFTEGNEEINIVGCTGAKLDLSFGASDAASSDVITYEGTELPEGAVLDASTGAFSWEPSTAGKYSFVVSATDQVSATAKRVSITVTEDRSSAIKAAASAFDPDETYVKASLDHYNTVYSQTVTSAEDSSTTDEMFTKQLQLLCAAAAKLELVSPLLQSDQSLDYHNIVYSSTFNTSIVNLTDGNPGTGSSYMLAPNKYHILDFGPDYKVSATAFGFQSNIFADRLAGSAVFGSNDGTSWTRLTPGLTAFTQEFQTLAVDDQYKNSKFRYIKIQLLQTYPDIIHNTVQNLFEMTEFRIFGKRYETGNQIAGVSIGSDQSVSGKVSIGDTIRLTITAKESIKNVAVQIQGKAAKVKTEDNINWTAEASMDDVTTGAVTFSIDYERADGSKGDTVYVTTDGTSLFLVDKSQLLDVSKLATVKASDPQWPGNGLSADQVGYLLFDGNVNTCGDLNKTNGSYYTVDFGEGATVKLSEIVLMPRMTTNHYGRLNGMVIQGSNDNTNWTNLTKEVSGAQYNTWYDIRSNDLQDKNAYRYFRLYNASAWSGDVAEVEFYGQYNAAPELLASKITSIDSVKKEEKKISLPKLPAGYILSMKASSDESVIALDGTVTSPRYDTLVALVLTVTRQSDMLSADTISISTLVRGRESAQKIDVAKLATVTASAAQWAAAGTAGLSAEQIGYYLFDGNAATAGDLVTGNGSYYTVDFGEGAAVELKEIKLLPRASNSTRLNGMVIQGSNDNLEWTSLTNPVSGATESTWIDITLDKIQNNKAYRYCRIYNSAAWFGNVAEIEFYGSYDFNIDYFNTKIVSSQDYTLGSYYLYSQETAAVYEEMSQSGADMLKLTTRLLDARNLLISTSMLEAENIQIVKDQVSASTLQWGATGATVQDNAWRAFDNDLSTAVDCTSNPSWVLVDLGQSASSVSGSAVTAVSGSAINANGSAIGSVKYYPRAGNSVQINRINGSILQGSVDGVNYVNLYTINGITAASWYTAVIKDNTVYRYFRLYSTSGFANVAELMLYKPVVDKTLLQLLLNQASNIDSKQYTEESVRLLEVVEANEQIIVNDNGATQEEVNAAADHLQSAMKGLVVKVTPTPQAPTPAEETPTPTPQAPTPTEDPPTPTPQAPTPAEETPTPTPEAPTPVAETPTPAPQASTPVSETPSPASVPMAEKAVIQTGDGTLALTYVSTAENKKLKLSLQINADAADDVTGNIIVPVTTDNLMKQIADNEYSTIDISVNMPDKLINTAAEAINIRLASKLMLEAKEKGTDIKVAINDSEGQLRYSWCFSKEALNNLSQDINDVNLSLNTALVSGEELGHLLGKQAAFANKENNLLINFAYEGILPGQAAVKIYVGDQKAILPGKRIYLYHINEQTGRLEALPYSSNYYADKDGFITLDIIHCSDYVAMQSKADSGIVTSLLNQISVTPAKKTLYAGQGKKNTTNIIVDLPAVLEQVGALEEKTSGSAIGAAVVTFKSGNTKVAVVNNDGIITAAKKGKTVIYVKISLYSGKSKTFKINITVK